MSELFADRLPPPNADAHLRAVALFSTGPAACVAAINDSGRPTSPAFAVPRITLASIDSIVEIVEAVRRTPINDPPVAMIELFRRVSKVAAISGEEIEDSLLAHIGPDADARESLMAALALEPEAEHGGNAPR
jgi:hypothetical protein